LFTTIFAFDRRPAAVGRLTWPLGDTTSRFAAARFFAAFFLAGTSLPGASALN
jgi:hypothetical protein